MVIFTLSPTPIFGGTFDRFAMGQWDMTELSPGKFLLVFAQTNPNHLVAQVVTLTAGPAFGITFGTMKQIEALTDTFDFSVVALSSSRAVVYYTQGSNEGRFRVLDIDGSDDITESAPSDITFTGSFPLSGSPFTPRPAHFYDLTKRLSLAAIDSSNFYMIFMRASTSNNSAATSTFLSKFNVDAFEVITKTSQDNLQTVMGGSWNFADISIANGSTFDITNAFTAGQFIMSAGQSVGIIDGNSTKITDLSDGTIVNEKGITLEIATGEYVNLHPDGFLSFYTGGSWGAIIDYADPQNGSNVMEALRLDDTHVCFIQRASSTSTDVYLQIIRKLADDLWQHQTTSTSNLGFIPFQTSTNNWWFNNANSQPTSIIGNGPRFAHLINSTNLATVYATSDTTVKFTVLQV